MIILLSLLVVCEGNVADSEKMEQTVINLISTFNKEIAYLFAIKMDWTKATEQISKIKVKNVVDMPLFYGMLVLILSVISGIFCQLIWLTVVLLIFAGVLIVLAVFGYFFFTFKNPDYLRSEEYHLRKQSLEILGDKEKLLPIDGQNIVDIANPYPSQIEENKNEPQD